MTTGTKDSNKVPTIWKSQDQGALMAIALDAARQVPGCADAPYDNIKKTIQEYIMNMRAKPSRCPADLGARASGTPGAAGDDAGAATGDTGADDAGAGEHEQEEGAAACDPVIATAGGASALLRPAHDCLANIRNQGGRGGGARAEPVAAPLTAFEEERERRIAANQAVAATLGISLPPAPQIVVRTKPSARGRGAGAAAGAGRNPP